MDLFYFPMLPITDDQDISLGHTPVGGLLYKLYTLSDPHINDSLQPLRLRMLSTWDGSHEALATDDDPRYEVQRKLAIDWLATVLAPRAARYAAKATSSTSLATMTRRLAAALETDPTPSNAQRLYGILTRLGDAPAVKTALKVADEADFRLSRLRPGYTLSREIVQGAIDCAKTWPDPQKSVAKMQQDLIDLAVQMLEIKGQNP